MLKEARNSPPGGMVWIPCFFSNARCSFQRWANDDLRSINGQVEVLLRRALQEGGRLKGPGTRGTGARARAGGGDRTRSTPSAKP